jgi:hypothetical protein
MSDFLPEPLTIVLFSLSTFTLFADPKSFNFTSGEWVSTADQEAALCLSFNGFEEQAEI